MAIEAKKKWEKNGKKKYLEGFQKTRGGVKAKLKKTKQKQIFFMDGFPNRPGVAGAVLQTPS